jgi:hypothetical protein
VPDDVERDLLHAAPLILGILQNPTGGWANVTEWAKQQACWELVKALPVSWPSSLSGGIGARVAAEIVKEGRKDQKVLNGIQAQMVAVNAGGAFWQDVLRWGRERGALSPKESGILDACAGLPTRLPSEAQSVVAIATFERLKKMGLQLELP